MSEQETFDGQEIAGYVAALPAMKLEAPDSYQRGTYMTLQVEVRVRSVRYEEVPTGKHKGDLVKVHVLATEDVKILGVLTPQERLAILQAQQAEVEQEIIDAEIVSDTAAPMEIEAPVAEGADDEWEYAEPEGVTEQEAFMQGDHPVEVSAGF